MTAPLPPRKVDQHRHPGVGLRDRAGQRHRSEPVNGADPVSPMSRPDPVAAGGRRAVPVLGHQLRRHSVPTSWALNGSTWPWDRRRPPA